MHTCKPICGAALFWEKNEEYIFLKRGQGRIKCRSFDQFFLSNKKPCRLPARYCRCQLGNNTGMRSEET